MKKKILLTLLTGLSTVILFACGTKEATVTEPVVADNTTEEETIPTTDTVQTEEENSEEAVTIEVIENATHSEEYNLRFEAGERIGGSYVPTGEAEVAQYGDWKEGYTALIDDLSSDADVAYESTYALIYVDDDDIPELAYKTDGDKICVATFGGGCVNIFSSQIDSILYCERDNALFASENVEASLNDYVVAIKDGFWIAIAYGTKSPLDIWAEDSFDENGNPIISYWEINEQELASQNEYDETLGKYFDSALGTSVTEFKGAAEIKETINSL